MYLILRKNNLVYGGQGSIASMGSYCIVSKVRNFTDEKEDRLIHFPYPNGHDNFDIGVFCV